MILLKNQKVYIIEYYMIIIYTDIIITFMTLI